MCKRLMRSHVTSNVFPRGVVVPAMKITDGVVAAPFDHKCSRRGGFDIFLIYFDTHQKILCFSVLPIIAHYLL